MTRPLRNVNDWLSIFAGMDFHQAAKRTLGDLVAYRNGTIHQEVDALTLAEAFKAFIIRAHGEDDACTYPDCKCIVTTSTKQLKPYCPKRAIHPEGKSQR